ncbi:unnamed protein product [Rotaria sp. Silwood1]|nr:unnamed protein product [Rotaria sp. Silwood1]
MDDKSGGVTISESELIVNGSNVTHYHKDNDEKNYQWSIHHDARNIDDVFMTMNLSKEEILRELDETIKTDSNIKITSTISQSLEYLDATVENNNG